MPKKNGGDMRVELSDLEFETARLIGKARYNNARSKNIIDRKESKQSNAQVDLAGACAEIAAAKLLNVYPDLQLDQLSDWDIKSKNNFTIDVKTTHHQNGRLMATMKKKDIACDFYMLMVGSELLYECRGFAHRVKLFHPSSIGEMNGNKLYMLTQDQLMSYETWMNLFNR